MNLFPTGNNFNILQGNNLDTLKRIDDCTFDCAVTSPPYYGLRNYLPEDSPEAEHEIGQEQSPKEFVDALVSVFREVRRVLRDDGVLWINIGDSYSSYKDGAYNVQSFDKKSGNTKDRPKANAPNRTPSIMKAAGIKHKEVIGIPWMLAFALREDGWYLRQDIIWSKNSGMPESVKDRCTRSHEYVFMLTKQPNYYFDHEAIKEPTVDGNELKNKRSVWQIGTSSYKGAHFATFPEQLVEPCVLSSSRVGGLVLDPFNGAATTGAVALKHGRRYVGLELNPEYVELSDSRLSKVAEVEGDSVQNMKRFSELFGQA